MNDHCDGGRRWFGGDGVRVLVLVQVYVSGHNVYALTPQISCTRGWCRGGEGHRCFGGRVCGLWRWSTNVRSIYLLVVLGIILINRFRVEVLVVVSYRFLLSFTPPPYSSNSIPTFV